MPIDVVCDACGQKLRVADTHAGKKAKCPKCQSIIQIPALAKDHWFVQTPDGQQYGPISKAELDAWVTEGRVDYECQVLQEGWTQWQWADTVYPDLQRGADQPEHEGFPNLVAPGGSGSDLPSITPSGSSPNPFAAPRTTPAPAEGGGEAYSPRLISALVQTRPWVLFLSILGFVMGGLGMLFSLIALLMTLASGISGLFLIMLLSLISPALGLVASWFLFRYAQSIGLFMRSKATRELEDALEAQKSFWKLVGIVTAVLLTLYLLALAFMFALMGTALRF